VFYSTFLVGYRGLPRQSNRVFYSTFVVGYRGLPRQSRCSNERAQEARVGNRAKEARLEFTYWGRLKPRLQIRTTGQQGTHAVGAVGYTPHMRRNIRTKEQGLQPLPRLPRQWWQEAREARSKCYETKDKNYSNAKDEKEKKKQK